MKNKWKSLMESIKTYYFIINTRCGLHLLF